LTSSSAAAPSDLDVARDGGCALERVPFDDSASLLPSSSSLVSVLHLPALRPSRQHTPPQGDPRTRGRRSRAADIGTDSSCCGPGGSARWRRAIFTTELRRRGLPLLGERHVLSPPVASRHLE